MMRERDIRQGTYEENKDSKQSKLVTFSALTTGVGMLAAFGFGQFSFFFGSAIGIPFAILTGIIAVLVPNMHHDHIETPISAYISCKGTTEVNHQSPEINE